MILEDGTHYKGEFKGTGYLNGKGLLTLTTGQTIEGNLTGSWHEGIKISNATFMAPKTHDPEGSNTPKHFGSTCIPMKQKWKALYRHCYQLLGIPEKINPKNPFDHHKIWQNVAIVISNSHDGNMSKFRGERGISNSMNNLDIIPQFCRETLTKEGFAELKQYLSKVRTIFQV